VKIDVLTLFTEMFESPFSYSLINKAREKGLLHLNFINIRDFTEDKHKTADDTPYGGGPGMVMKPDPIFKAIKKATDGSPDKKRVILMCPTGKKFDQNLAKELSKEEHIIIICGHYEGIDERIRKNFVTDEISIGDYVLTGGELPAMVIIDSIARLIPSVVKEEESLINESFYGGLLDYPSYTRPEEFLGDLVPEVLTSGNHAKIYAWRRKNSLKKTLFKRPDLLAKADLNKEDCTILEEIVSEI